MFIYAGWQWIIRLNVELPSTYEKNIRIVKIFQEALRAALARRTRPHRFLVYGDMFLFGQDVVHAQPETSWFSPAYKSVLAEFLHVVELFFRQADRITMEQDTFHAILEYAHPNDYCDLHPCPWTSHVCNNVYNCPLLAPDRAELNRLYGPPPDPE